MVSLADQGALVTRQRKMIELVIANLKEAMTEVETSRQRKEGSHHRVAILTPAVDEALANLEHALSDHPCNHGACHGTTLIPLLAEEGELAHTDDR